ncbi:hypothetical protein PFLUV_G00237250 [Perca fluviatilis]|uniref:Uncharacterized protein n=1 Tax=Perca fluviatilis TaxID=8168 RepID=A0A6A5DRD9_PERFL|nr:hypothetical protein PFLUV_G00237250 [Perca fluviatilis]
MSEQALVHELSSPCQSPGQQTGQQTGLHRAAMVGNSDVTAALIQGGCAVDLQDRDGNTALHEASWHGFSHCVKLLVKSGADVHIRNKSGNTALHLACQNAHAPAARLLLLGGATPDTKNNRGDTCLHMAARYNNQILVKILLSSLCSVKERNQAGDTALHVAATLNHKKTVQLLLEAGTDGKIRNNAGKTALEKARDNNHKDMAHLLARAPQVHRFMRGRTIRKQRERVTSESRTQSDPRVEILPNKDSSSVAEESPSSEQTESRTAFKVRPHHHHHHQQQQQQQQQQHYQSPAAISSHYIHRKRRRGKEPASNHNDLRKGENDTHVKKNLLWDDGEDSAQNEKFYQLYTLYRDKDGNIKQAPADGCHCKPLLKKLEGQLKDTQEEMRLHILNVQEQVNSKLGKMDHRNRHQIKVLDMLNQERAAAERKTMVYEIEQRAAQGREEALMTQVAVSHELKRWCLSQLKDMDVHQMGTKTYFEMKVDRPPDDYENTGLFAANHTSGPLLGSVDPLWQPAGVQDSPTAAAMPLCGEGLSTSPSSSSQSTISAQGPRLIQHQERDRRHFGELMSARRREGIHSEGARTLEFFINRPAEPTFSQERNNQHAVEVTQRFFETVSTQLERWYERKMAELERQTALRAQQDRNELLQQIGTLEEELQRLRTNENAES